MKRVSKGEMLEDEVKKVPLYQVGPCIQSMNIWILFSHRKQLDDLSRRVI